MTNSKTTRKALLSSALALLMCVAMLIATTFAWFTDTASTAVNKIQSGKLDVALEMKNPEYTGTDDQTHAEWISAEDQTLKFLQKDAESNLTQSENILWEPGCTYELPELRIVNKGNLAFKYKIAITGATGNTELLDVIKFTTKFNEEEIDLDSWEGKLIPTEKTPTTGTNEEAGNSSSIVISGHMDENAGNEYQGLTLEGISITVYATQYAYEYDSEVNTYDLNSMYVFDNYVNVTKSVVSGGETVIQDDETNATIKATIPSGSLVDGITELALIKKPTSNPSNIVIDTGESALTTDVKIIDTGTKKTITAQGNTYFTISIQLGQVDLQKFYHKGLELTKATGDFNAAGQYKYDENTGVVTFTTKDFSTFTAVFKYSGGNGSEYYPYLLSTANDLLGLAANTNNNKDYSGKYFKMTNDINLDNKEWTPIGNGTRSSASISGNSFTGTFNGNEKTISNVNNSLFGIVTGTVKNVKIVAAINNTNSDSVGAVAGILAGGKISEVEVSGSVSATQAAGGIVGRVLAEGTVENCTNTATVESTSTSDAAGGIVGKAYYTIAGKEMNITGCNNTGTIKGKYAAGGIAGFSAANVKNCVNSGNIEMTCDSVNSVGGIIGEQTNYGTISDNKNTVDITAKGTVGGIIGWIRYQDNSKAYANNMTIVVSGNENSGNISGTGLGTGGIVGLAYNQAKVTGNKNTAANISGGTFVAGIVGGLQFNDKNLDMNEGVRFIVTGNTSTTTSENISGNCKHLFAYNNDPNNDKFANISENTKE